MRRTCEEWFARLRRGVAELTAEGEGRENDGERGSGSCRRPRPETGVAQVHGRVMVVDSSLPAPAGGSRGGYHAVCQPPKVEFLK